MQYVVVSNSHIENRFFNLLLFNADMILLDFILLIDALVSFFWHELCVR